MTENKRLEAKVVKTNVVDEMPTNEGKLGERNRRIVEEVKKLPEGKILEVELDKEALPQRITGGVKYALKRLDGEFKVRVKNKKLYVQRLEKKEDVKAKAKGAEE